MKRRNCSRRACMLACQQYHWALRCGAILKKCVCSLVHLQIPKWSKMVLKSNFMTHTVVVNFIFYHRPRYRSSADLQRGPRVRNAKHFSRWNMLLVKWDGPIQNHLHRILGLKDCIFQLVQHMNASTMIPLACMASLYSIWEYIYIWPERPGASTTCTPWRFGRASRQFRRLREGGFVGPDQH